MKYLLIILLVFGLSGCQDVKQPKKPKNLIPQDEMSNILVDAYLANAARSVDNKYLLVKGLKMDSLIFAKYGIDSLQFIRSNDYYASNISTYMNIFQNVDTKLSNLQKGLDSIRKIEGATRDSLSSEPIERNRVELINDSL